MPIFIQQRGNFTNVALSGCVEDVRYRGRFAIDRDLAHLKAAAEKSQPMEASKAGQRRELRRASSSTCLVRPRTPTWLRSSKGCKPTVFGREALGIRPHPRSCVSMQRRRDGFQLLFRRFWAKNRA
jgi:hypothetical protein